MQARVQLKFKYKDQQFSLKVKRIQKLEKAMIFAAEKLNKKRDDLEFTLDQMFLTGQETPEFANLIDGDEIMIFDKQKGKK